MTDKGREQSPIAERPANLSDIARIKTTRSVSGSALPTVDLDPTTLQLLEENESMLYEINRLQRELRTSQEEVSKLNTIITSQQEEVAAMREKLNDANTHARDASGRIINYKVECERLTGENTRLAREYAEVCAELEQHTEKIRHDTNGMRPDTARGLANAQIRQFHREMIGLFPSVQHVVHSLRRSIPASSADTERVLESVRKERHELQRLADTVRRMGGGWERNNNNNNNKNNKKNEEENNEMGGNETEREKERDVLARAQKGEELDAPGDLAVLIRWMIVEALDAGITSTRGNLTLFENAINTDPNSPVSSSTNKGRNNNNGTTSNTNSNNNNRNNTPTPSEERGGVSRWAKGAARRFMGDPKK
ncbi:uncharacterized protein TM35_000461200 [Trypanosoma theileri]|uniref:Uncharacterized protein n=1 Tax=Trypanosoma theileri TaxID=67003 RepID=A0A1X0NI84_9TRYP|nr:uncharacterized protein TM35_000461200 [Trypanosoma theileri]ORC84301.1 hypothetical protein TM35_000461200 [Trypanosoma theileri]